MSTGTAAAAIFRCVNANGTTTYSDRACAEEPPPRADSPLSAGDAPTRGGDSPKTKKASRVLALLHIAPAEPETPVLQRTVDDAAPDLVKNLDPDNAAWTPANGKWHSVSEFVKSDLRRDVQSALRQSTAQVAATTAREYAARTSDADMDAILAFLQTPDGARYIAFQNEIRPLLYSALSALMAQEPISEDAPADAVLRPRKQLLYLATEYRVERDGGGPALRELQPGSVTVVENAALREGTTLDALVSEYQPLLTPFQTFTDSALAKRFYVALEPALRTEIALSSTATTDFAEQEFSRYFARWRSIYGPTLHITNRTAVIIRGRLVTITHSTQHVVNPSGSAEAMAIQCEQRESSQQAIGNMRDGNAQAASFRAIQNRCRAEQRLPPF